MGEVVPLGGEGIAHGFGGGGVVLLKETEGGEDGCCEVGDVPLRGGIGIAHVSG